MEAIIPQQGIIFDGQFIGLPGAYFADDVTTAAPNTPPTTPPLILIAYSWGPKPKVPITFTNTQNLVNAMRGAPGAAYVPFLANPSPALNGAQLVTLIDPSQSTQAFGALAASGALGTQTLMTSVLYGPPSNQMTGQVVSGSTAGLKLILTDNFSGNQLTGDNLTVPFQLAYSGATSGQTATYTVSGGASGSFSVSGANGSADTFTIPTMSGAYSTVGALVQYLNGTGFYTAQNLSATQGQLPCSLLTVTGGVALAAPVSGALQFTNVRAYLQDINFWINQFASTMVTSVVSGSALDTAAWLPVTGATASFFSGARGVPPINADYASALTAALSTPGWTVFCDSNNAAVQSLLAAHCEIASSAPYGQWRRGFTGSSIGDTPAFTQAAAIGLDSLQMNYLYPGIYRTNTVTGNNQLYGGLYAAAAAAGIATGNTVATPLTNKVLNATGVENANAGVPLTQSQLVSLQNAGVMAIWTPQSAGVPTILSDVTTWQADTNPENTSSQQVACRYWLAYTMVNTLQKYVGSIAYPTNEAIILNATKAALNALIYTGGASNGVLAAWDTKSLFLTYNGANQTASITVSIRLVGQNRYITVFATVLPLSFTISAATP
jgi:hypothetical protein